MKKRVSLKKIRQTAFILFFFYIALWEILKGKKKI